MIGLAFAELGLFPHNETAYLGDTAQPKYCPKSDSTTSCYQSVRDPGYQPFQPNFNQAYMQFALDATILKVGRRSRHLGLGLLYDDGKTLFQGTEVYLMALTLILTFLKIKHLVLRLVWINSLKL